MGFDAACLWHHSGVIRNLGQDATVFCLKGKTFSSATLWLEGSRLWKQCVSSWDRHHFRSAATKYGTKTLRVGRKVRRVALIFVLAPISSRGLRPDLSRWVSRISGVRLQKGLTFWKVVEDGYEIFARRLVMFFSASNYCGEFDNAGAMMGVDEMQLCSFQVRFSHVLIGVDIETGLEKISMHTARRNWVGLGAVTQVNEEG